MSKLRYWKAVCSIGFASPCNKTTELDIKTIAGLSDDDLELMSDEEAREMANEMAEEWARDRLSYSVKPA